MGSPRVLLPTEVGPVRLLVHEARNLYVVAGEVLDQREDAEAPALVVNRVRLEVSGSMHDEGRGFAYGGGRTIRRASGWGGWSMEVPLAAARKAGEAILRAVNAWAQTPEGAAALAEGERAHLLRLADSADEDAAKAEKSAREERTKAAKLRADAAAVPAAIKASRPERPAPGFLSEDVPGR